jgi:glutaminase
MNLMLAKNKLPTYDSHELNMEKALEAMKLYHSIESILVEVESLALFGACLANNGIAPLTNEKIISDKAISAINPMIMTCGMSVRVGQFVEAYGLPAVYGTCGNLLSIVPGVGALVSISPITDEYSVSLRG